MEGELKVFFFDFCRFSLKFYIVYSFFSKVIMKLFVKFKKTTTFLKIFVNKMSFSEVPLKILPKIEFILDFFQFEGGASESFEFFS